MEREIKGVIKHSLPPFLREKIKNVSDEKIILIPQIKERVNNIQPNMYDKKNENIGVAEARHIAQTIVEVLRKYDYFSEQELDKVGENLLHTMHTQRSNLGSIDVSEVAKVVVDAMGDRKLSRQDIRAIENVVLDYRQENEIEQDKFKQAIRTLVGYQKPRTQENEDTFELSNSPDNSSSYTLSDEEKMIEVTGDLEDKAQEKIKEVLQLEDESELTSQIEKETASWKTSTKRGKTQVLDQKIEDIRNRFLIAKLQELELNCGTNGFAMLLQEQKDKRVEYLHKILNDYVDKRDFADDNKYNAFIKNLETKLKDGIEPHLNANRDELEKQLKIYLGKKGSMAIVHEVVEKVRTSVWQDGSALTSYMNVAGAQVDLQAKVAALEANHGKGAGIVQWRIDEYEQLKLMSSQVRAMMIAVVNHKATIDKDLKEITARLEKEKNAKVNKEELVNMMAGGESMATCTKAMTDSLYALLALNKVDIDKWCDINNNLKIAPLRFRDKANFKDHFQDILTSLGEVDLMDENVKKEFFNRAVQKMIDGKERTIFIDWIEDNIKSMYTRSGIQKTTANAILQLLHAELILLGENRKETKVAIQDLINAGKLEQEQVKLLLDSGFMGQPSNEDEQDNSNSGSGGNDAGNPKDANKEKKEEDLKESFSWVTGEAKEISAEQLKEIVKTRNKGKFTIMGSLANFMEKTLVTLGLACNTKKNMKTPAINKVVKQREKAEKRLEKEEKRQAKLANDPKQKSFDAQKDLYEPVVPMSANFEGDHTLFVTVEGKEYTYEEMNAMVLTRFKEELSNSTIDEDKIQYLLAVIAQLNKYKKEEKEADGQSEFLEKKQKFFNSVVKDNLNLETGFDIKYPLNSWMQKRANVYLKPIAEDIEEYLKEDGSLDIQKIEQTILAMEQQVSQESQTEEKVESEREEQEF